MFRVARVVTTTTLWGHHRRLRQTNTPISSVFVVLVGMSGQSVVVVLAVHGLRSRTLHYRQRFGLLSNLLSTIATQSCIVLVGLPPWEVAREEDPRYRMVTKGGLSRMLQSPSVWPRPICSTKC